MDEPGLGNPAIAKDDDAAGDPIPVSAQAEVEENVESEARELPLATASPQGPGVLNSPTAEISSEDEKSGSNCPASEDLQEAEKIGPSGGSGVRPADVPITPEDLRISTAAAAPADFVVDITPPDSPALHGGRPAAGAGPSRLQRVSSTSSTRPLTWQDSATDDHFLSRYAMPVNALVRMREKYLDIQDSLGADLLGRLWFVLWASLMVYLIAYIILLGHLKKDEDLRDSFLGRDYYNYHSVFMLAFFVFTYVAVYGLHVTVSYLWETAYPGSYLKHI